jgi:hypothetical protein
VSFGPQRPGTALEDAFGVEPGRVAPEAVDTYETRHLCLTCVHASVCAIASTVRALGADGQVVISKCAAFYALGGDDAPLPTAEPI